VSALPFEYSQEQSRAIQIVLDDAAQQGRSLVSNSNSGYAGAVNTVWRGQAALAGLGTQDELMGHWNSVMEPILVELKQGLGVADNLVLSADESGQQEHRAITPDGGGTTAFPNFTRI
jgi:hypothetical protein